MTGCLGAFVAADVVTLYAMLGMMTIGATGLVIHDETPRAWRAGAIYFGLALAAESVLLLGLVMAAAAVPGDSLLIRDAAAAALASPQRDLILTLIVGGLGLKAGIVPMHVWMPLAYPAAPVPASSVMSGAMVKVSIIGLIRFLPPGTALPDWGQLLTVVGLRGRLLRRCGRSHAAGPESGARVFEREPDGRHRRRARHGARAPEMSRPRRTRRSTHRTTCW